MSLPRFFYSLFFYVSLPIIVLRLLWRARRQPGYLADWRARFGYYPARADERDNPDSARLIWIHAVSVGETRAAIPLMDALLAAYPACRLLLTSTTPTGRATAQKYCESHPRVLQTWLPYDLPCAVARFFARYRPVLGVILETEIWPNLLFAADRRRLPMALVNARLSERSARAYQRVSPLIRPAVARFSLVAAQSEADANRLTCLGAHSVRVCGNLKFDLPPDAESLALGDSWRAALKGRPVWLAASTREGEERLLLACHDAFLRRWKETRRGEPLPILVLVPRHPQRFDAVAEEICRQGFQFCRRSERLPDENCAVWLGDSMGEMPAYYRLADAAFIGGTLLPFGGQNLIEAASVGCPLILGRHTFNFAQASEDALTMQAARQVADTAELEAVLYSLFADRVQFSRLAEASLAFTRRYQGATLRTMDALSLIFPPADK